MRASSGALTQSEEEAALAKDPQWVKFLESVSAKGYFKGCEQGSSDFDERRQKVVLAYKKKAAQKVRDTLCCHRVCTFVISCARACGCACAWQQHNVVHQQT